MADPIKAIVRTFTSERDSNGNCYKFAYIYATAAGIYKFVIVDDPCGISTLLKEAAGVEFGQALEVEEVLPKRLWQAKHKHCTMHYSHTPEFRRALVELFAPVK
jgi:hypothetical protein